MKKQEQAGEHVAVIAELLADEKTVVRQKARELLVALGDESVIDLCRVLKESENEKARWEAAKALGEIGDPYAIPALVGALEDNESDVGWVAADGLKRFRKAAWPDLLHAVIDRGSSSINLRHGVHHVLRDQREHGYDDLLHALCKALESGTASTEATVAAYSMLDRLREHSKKTITLKREKVRSF